MERAVTATATLPTGRGGVFGADSFFTGVFAVDFETGTGFLICGAGVATVFSDFGADAEEEEVAALPTGTDLAGAGLAGFGADFTTAAAAGRATADCLLLDAAGADPAAALETGFLAGAAVLDLGVDGDFCTVVLRMAEGAGDGFFAEAALGALALEAAAFFTGADLAAAVFFTGEDLAAAVFFTGAPLGAAFFTGATLEAPAFFTGATFEALPFDALALPASAALAPAPFLMGAAFEGAAFFTGTALVDDDFFAATPVALLPLDGLAAFPAVAWPAAFFAAGFPVGLGAGRDTVFAAVLVATGLAVFLTALAAFFADFLAATKRSSLDSPGPGKAGLYSLPRPQQQPRDRMLTRPLLHWPDGIPDTVRQPCGREPGRWRKPPAWRSCGGATDSQRPILRQMSFAANLSASGKGDERAGGRVGHGRFTPKHG